MTASTPRVTVTYGSGCIAWLSIAGRIPPHDLSVSDLKAI
jgi:hypothetical protein